MNIPFQLLQIWFPILRETIGCADSGGATWTGCNINVVDCDETSQQGHLTACDAIWNKILCQTDCCYFTPVIAGGSFMLQTRFADLFNQDTETPTGGWGDWVFVELYDINDNLLSSDVAAIASRYGVGTLDGGATSYQLIEVDTSLPIFDGVNCFRVRIFARDLAGNITAELCSHHYGAISPCDRVIKLESRYPTFDCFGQYYGLPDSWIGNTTSAFIYSNAFYLHASLLEGEDQVIKTVRSGRISNVEVREAYRLVMERIIPAYQKNVISRIWAPGIEVFIDDQPFELENFTVENRLNRQAGRMFLFNVDVNRTCELDYQCATLIEVPQPIVVPPLNISQCVECIEPTCVGP